MNFSRILLILVLVLINKSYTKNVAPLALEEDPRNYLDQKELNEYPTDRWCKSDI